MVSRSIVHELHAGNLKKRFLLYTMLLVLGCIIKFLRGLLHYEAFQLVSENSVLEMYSTVL